MIKKRFGEQLKKANDFTKMDIELAKAKFKSREAKKARKAAKIKFRNRKGHRL